MRRRQIQLVLILCVLLASIGCAIRNSNITTEMQWQLNTVSQLTDLQSNYTTFFKDAGDAHRAGTLSDANIRELNAIGDRLRIAIEAANQGWNTYMATRTSDKKTLVINLILTAEQILLELTTKKAQIMTRGIR